MGEVEAMSVQVKEALTQDYSSFASFWPLFSTSYVMVPLSLHLYNTIRPKNITTKEKSIVNCPEYEKSLHNYLAQVYYPMSNA